MAHRSARRHFAAFACPYWDPPGGLAAFAGSHRHRALPSVSTKCSLPLLARCLGGVLTEGVAAAHNPGPIPPCIGGSSMRSIPDYAGETVYDQAMISGETDGMFA